MTTRIVPLTLPLPPHGPPDGFNYDLSIAQDVESPHRSDTEAFDEGVNERDFFRGGRRCIVCGISDPVDRGHIISPAEERTWRTVRARAYVPSNSKQKAEHDPRNGVTMCMNHRKLFVDYKFFIRFHAETQKYYLINFGDLEHEAMYHGKAVALDYAHPRAPYPAVFLLHEIRTRGFWPWQEHNVEILTDTYQDWVVQQGYLGDDGHLDHNAPPPAPPQPPPPGPYGAASSPATSFAPNVSGSSPVSGRKVTLESPQAIFAKTLAFQKTMPTWRAAVLENESWSGTATDNIQKYLELVEPEPS